MPKRRFDEAIKVKSPCSESWEQMAGNEQVRFCSHCAKDVNDVSTMTRRDAMRLVRRSNGNLCVRYQVNPTLGRPIFVSRSRQLRDSQVSRPVSSRRRSLWPMMLTHKATSDRSIRCESNKGTNPVQRVQLFPVMFQIKKGRLSRSRSCSLTNLGTYEYKAVNASEQGYYEFKELPPGSYTVKIEAGGFEAKQIDNVQSWRIKHGSP